MNASKPLSFLDTNILIYALDVSDTQKNECARTLLKDLIARNELALSTQVLREFLNVYSKPQMDSFSAEDALKYARTAIEPYVTAVETPDFLREAFGKKITHSISFYDALILQAAIELGCGILYSEDFQHGRTYSGVEVINPFI